MKITFDVKEENIKTVMLLLENLKEGLVSDIKVDKIYECRTSYKPKTKEIIKENEPVIGKYVSVETFKKKLRAKK